MRILFVTTNDIHDIHGGAKASSRNLECLQDIYGKNNVEISYIAPQARMAGLLERCKSFVVELTSGRVLPAFSSLKIKPQDYDLLFIDSSLLGCQIKKLRKNSYKGKIVSFFHNCEADYKAMFFEGHPTIRNRLYMHAVQENEKLTIEYSDACVFINSRDLHRTSELYNISPRNSQVISMTMKDSFREIPSEIQTDKPIYTILGSYFKPNVDGIKWFVANVLPHVNITLRIVGKDMHLLRNDIDCSGIEIHSNVPDLAVYMAESDYMLYPVFEGSGMKIKTCEALMWGKNIVATPEAFSGYGITDYTKVGACCQTAEEFIAAINRLVMPRYNAYSREYYKKNFSYGKSVTDYRQLFTKIGV